MRLHRPGLAPVASLSAATRPSMLRIMHRTAPELSSLPPEERLLLAATDPDVDRAETGRCGPETAPRHPPLADVDPERLLRLAMRNKVLGRCGRFLVERCDGFEELSPSWWKLARLIELQAGREIRHHLQALALMRELSAAGVECCSLKGTFLSLELYGDPTFRDTADLDLLVRRGRLDEAVHIAESLGYELASLHSVPRSGRHRDLLGRVKAYNLQLKAPEREIRLELHWALGPHRRLPGDADGSLWDDLDPARISGVDMWKMRDPLALLYLALHGARHRWSRLGWVADFARFATGAPEAAERASEMSRAEGLRVVWDGACLVADHWYGTTLHGGRAVTPLQERRAVSLLENAALFRDDLRKGGMDSRRYERATCDTRIASWHLALRRYLLPWSVVSRSPGDLNLLSQGVLDIPRKLRRLLGGP